MPKNSIDDLTNHLFAAIERLSDEELTKRPEELQKEIERSEAICVVSDQIVNIAKVKLRFVELTNSDKIDKRFFDSSQRKLEEPKQ
jgi:uncharacterized protein YbaP (TraB family)